MTNIMETPFKGIPETILEELNEDAPSPNVSVEVNENFYSPLKDSMEVKMSETVNFQNKNETIYKDCFAQTEIQKSTVVHKEAQTDNLGLRRKLILRRSSLDSSISTPPGELRKQIFDLRDELIDAYDFHDNELKVLSEELLVDKNMPEKDDDVEHLRKSLADAERIYLDACTEISNLKYVNLELNKKMEDESKNWLTCKHDLEGQISQLNMDIRKKAYEIENLKKDKEDFDFTSQLQNEKFEKRIKDLEAALVDARDIQPPASNSNTQTSKPEVTELQRKISSLQSKLEESKEIIKQLEEESKEKIKRLDELEDVLKRKEELIAYNENQINAILLTNEELSSGIKKCRVELMENKTNYEETLKIFKDEWNNELKVLRSEKDSLNDIIQQLSRDNDEINEALKKNKTEFDLKTEEARLSMINDIEALKMEKEVVMEELKEFKNKYEEELEKIELDYKVKLKNEVELMKVEKKEEEEFSMKVEPSETIVKEEVEEVEEEATPSQLDIFVKEFTDVLIQREIVTLEEVERNGNVFYLLVDKYLEVLENLGNLQMEGEYKIKMEAYESCFEKLCSQLEASDSTLNGSNSFTSFAADVKSSTMVHDEMEATIVSDRTLMTHDPLAFTPFKTPKSILKSARKPVQRSLFSEQEGILEEKFKLVERLENRIEKLEDLASVFESEKERIKERFVKERERLKNSIISKSNEVENLRGRLICEMISLNPELENNLGSTSTDKILKIFIDTIMEKCKSVEDELREGFTKEKVEWESEKKHFATSLENLQAEKRILTDEIEIYEGKINKLTEELKDLREGNTNLTEKRSEIEERLANQNEELGLLYNRMKEFEAMENNLTSANEVITSLRNEVLGAETLKSEIHDLRLKIREKDSDLKNEIGVKEKLIKDLEKSKDFFEKVSKENEDLKKRIGQSEEMINDLEADLALAKKSQASNEVRVEELVNEIEILKKELSEGEMRWKGEIEEKNENLEKQSKELENLETRLKSEVDELNGLLENAESKNKNLQDAMKDLKEKMKELENAKCAKNELEEELKTSRIKSEKNEELKRSLDVKTEELEEIKRAKNELEEELKSARINSERREELERAKIELEEELTGARINLNENSELRKLLEAELEALKRAKIELEEELQCARANFESKGEECKKILDVKTEEFEELKRAKHELEEELTKNSNSLTESETKNDELQRFLETKTEELEGLKRAKIELEEELRSARANLNSLTEAESKGEEFKKILDIKTEELEELKRAKNELEEELRNAKNSLTETETENKKFLDFKTEVLEGLKRSKIELENELKNTKENLNSLVETNTKTEELMRVKVEEIEEIKRAKTVLEEELKNVKNTLTETETKNQKSLEIKTEELESLKRTKIELEEELRCAKANLNSLAESKSKGEEFKKILDIKTEQLEELKRAKNELEEELKNAKNSWTETETENKTFLETKTKEIEELKRAKIELEEELRGAKKNLNSLVEAESKSEELLRVKGEEMEVIKRAKIELEDELKCAQTNLEGSLKKSEELKQSLSIKAEELEQIRHVKNNLEEELKNTRTNLDLNSEKNEELKKCLEGKVEELEALVRAKNELEEKLKVAHTNWNLNSDESETLKKSLNIKTEELEEIKRAKNDLEEELKSTRANNSNLNLKTEELTKFLEVKTEELEEIRRAKSELEGAQSNLSEKNEELKRFLEVKTEELKEVNRAKNELKGELDQTLQELEGKRSEIETLKSELKSNCEKVLELEESRNVLRNKLEEAQICLKVHIEEREELKRVKEDLQFSEEKISKLSVKMEELTSDNSQKMVRTIELEKSIEKYQNQLKEVEGVKETLAGILSDIRSSLNLPQEDLTNGKSFTDKINEFKKVNGEVRGLFSLLSESDKRSDSIQNSCKSITDEINHLRSLAISLQDDLKKSDKRNLYSRKIGKLQEMNDHLTEIVNEILKSVRYPEADKLNLNSVRNMKNVQKQILEHFSNLIFHANKEESCPKVENLQKENLKLEKLNKAQLDEINKLKMEISTLQTEFLTGVNSHPAKKTGRKSDLCSRRMDKLEELNTILADLVTEIVGVAKIPNSEKLNLFSVRNVTSARKAITDYITNLVEGNTKEMNELKLQNKELDEECESYAKEIKGLQQKTRALEREAMAVRETLETEICKIKDDKHKLELEMEELRGQVKDANVSAGLPANCQCSVLQKELTEVKRTLHNKEQRILELEDLEVAISSSKAQVKYLEKTLNEAKIKCSEEEEKNKKLRAELSHGSRPSSTGSEKSRKSSEDQQLLDELRMRGSMTGGVVQEIAEKEKIRKLSKDNGLLKELCRTRYAEIQRLETEIRALKNSASKNSNQMDSPIRTRCYNTRSRKLPDDPKSPWRFFKDKENQNL